MTQPTVTFEVVPAFVSLIKLTFVGWGSYKSTWSILAPMFFGLDMYCTDPSQLI